MSLAALQSITSTSPYFNSHELLVHWMKKCELHIDKLEKILGESALSNLISKIQREDYAFVARCPHFRIIMKNLERRSEDSKDQKQSLYEVYERLLLAFTPFLKSRASRRESDLQAAGYDVQNSLTGPYPLLISPVINGGSNCHAESEQIKNCFLENPNAFDTKYMLTDFSSMELILLKDALQELNVLSPYLLCDVTMNVRLFAKILPATPDSSSMHMSLTTSYLPGVCFFSDGIFTDHERISESILHEALHMKYLQTIEIYSIHHTNYTGDTGRKFLCSWRPSGNIWPFSRAFGAFHVYSHLYIYYRALLEKGLPSNYRLTWVMSRMESCKLRALELRSWVDSEKEEAFTNEGIGFFNSLCKAVDTV
jgi:hypothetical protein